MSDTREFPNLPQSTWTCWQTHLVPLLESRGCDSIRFSGGNSGTLAFHHAVPLSNGQFAFTYSYDPGRSALTVTITDKPNILPAGTIFAYAEEVIYKCPQ